MIPGPIKRDLPSVRCGRRLGRHQAIRQGRPPRRRGFSGKLERQPAREFRCYL